ncbi:MAG: EAL domain-containing protein [Thermoanaerobaculia bacterium]
MLGGTYEITAAGLPNVITAVGIVALGVMFAVRDRFSALSRRFLTLTLAAGNWLFAFAWMYWSVSEATAFFWARVAFLTIPLIPVALYHFTITVHGKLSGREVHVMAAWAIGGLFSLIFVGTDWLISGLYLYSWGYYPRYTEGTIPFLAYFFFVLAATARHYIVEARKQTTRIDHKRSRTLLWATIAGYIGVVDFLPSLGIEVYPFGFIGIVGYLTVVWFVITRYQLVELTPAFAAAEILATMQGAVIVLGLDERIRVVNRAAAELLGGTASGLAGSPIHEIVGEEWSDPHSTPLHRWTFRERTMRWVASDGRRIPVSVSGSVVRDWDRRPAGIVLTAVDLTERELAEQRLREGEKRYRELVEQSPDLIAIHREGTMIFINPAGTRMLGATRPEEILGRKVLEFVHEASRPIVLERLKRLGGGMAVEQVEEKLVRLDGGVIDAEVTALPYLSEGEASILVMARDVTDRRRSEAELKQTLSLVKSTLESTADGILVVDRVGKIVSFNQRFVQMWNLAPEVLAAGNDDLAVASVLGQVQDPETFTAKIDELYEDPRAESYDTIEFKDSRIFERFSTPQWLDGNPVGRVWSFRDVSERRRWEEALRRRDRILEAVAFASEGFLRTADWHADIDRVLARFGAGTGVDRVQILRVDDAEHRRFSCVRSWTGGGWKTAAEADALVAERFATAWPRLSEGEIIQTRGEAGARRTAAEKCSVLLVPIAPEGELWGVMEWTDCSPGRIWSNAEIEALRTAADALAAAIQRQKTAAALQASEKRYRLLFERNLAGVYRNTLDGRVLDCNDACARILGYASREELIGSEAATVYFDTRDRDLLIRDLKQRRTVTNREVCFRRRDGKPVWVLENVSLMEDDAGELTLLEGTIIDITDRKEAERQIEYQAYHDALTDLPNRMLFLDRLAMSIAHAQRLNRHIAVMFLDLDHFKFVNDTLGHTVGDLLLRAVAKRLAESLRGEDTVARIGGDEFTILLANLASPSDATTVAQKILDSIAKPIRIDAHELFVTTSIGIALYPADGRDAETLLKNADSAMYRAKELGRNNYQLCTPAMNAQALERLGLENRLRRALETRELAVFFQPQVTIGTGAVVGVEALLRWKHPERGIIHPDEFIRVAEDSRLIFPIGEYVFRETCLHLKRIRSQGYPALRGAVNLSGRQFQQRDLVQNLRRVLDEVKLEPHAIEVEITEGAAMQNTEWTVGALMELKALGVGIVLDDFGTGHSSLNYLRRFPIDCLKIDKSFVRDLDRHPSDRAIVTAIITMAKGLNMRVIAEGVETEQQRIFLAERGCDELQGFLFSPALDPSELLFLLARKRSAPGAGWGMPEELPS